MALDALASTVASGLVIGLITAVVSVRLALGRFQRERLWDRKLQAYSEIFQALFHIKAYTTRILAQIEEGTQFDKEYMSELGSQATAGYNEIRKAVVMGTLVLGEDAVQRLQSLENDFDDPHYNMDIHDEASADLEAATKAIAALRPIAKKDLAIR